MTEIHTSDFHTHSTCSDGIIDPAALAHSFIKNKLAYASLSDHNTIAGIGIIKKILSGSDIELYTGMEVSCRDRIHILGLGMDENSNNFNNKCLHQEFIHIERASKQIVKLEENNFIVDRSVLKKRRGIITEFDIFRATENNGGIFEDFAQKWLFEKSPHYVKIERLSVEEAINLIHDTGGIAVWAHPGHTFKSNLLEISGKINEFVKLGLDGIEVFSSKHTRKHTELIHFLSRKFNLVMSGGSDYHGFSARKLGGFNTFGLGYDEQKLVNLPAGLRHRRASSRYY